MTENEKIIKVNIEGEMKTSYIDYSMSVIVSRALPDVRDGLKPVQRRILFGMHELGLAASRQYKKSARIVGEVLGKFHPHGDSSVYLAMVRMAQDWSLRYPLVDGQGNYGSVDGDPPAAMRYTEARLSKIAEEMLFDIEKETVDFQFNFDDSLEEPKILPARIPNLLINGSSGIAVGMATNMPPHNLADTIDATIAFIDNSEIDIEELIKIIKAPDFPTGATIYGIEGVKESYRTGRGRVVVRAKTHIEVASSGKEKIIVTEIPYQVNRAELLQKVSELVNEKKIEGIVYANDESDRTGMRIVFVLKKDAIANVVLNKLYKYTSLQSVFSVNNICLVDGRPKLLNLKDLILNFVKHRKTVVTRRVQFELSQAEKKAHILEGLLIALQNLDEVISRVRGLQTSDDAKNDLILRFGLSEVQAKAILELRLQRLTGMEQEKIKNEHFELLQFISRSKEILNSETLLMEIIKNELIELKSKYHSPRRTEIVHASEEFNPEDFFADEQVVITITNLGYIKRTPLTEFRIQNRGGKGAMGSGTREEDFIRHLYIATMHNTMLFFTEKGKCFWLKVYEIPEGSRTSKGRAMQNLLNIEAEDYVKAYMNLKTLSDAEYLDSNDVVLCTKKGVIKKTSLRAYSRPRQNGIVAINIREGDSLFDAKLTKADDEIMIAVKSGKAIRFPEEAVRNMGRTAAGVRGIRVSSSDKVVGMICVSKEQDILVVSENGFGKRSKLEDYRITNRGGKGVKTINITEKTGNLIAIKAVTDNDDLVIITKSGSTIRLSVATLRTMGRATQGVKLIELRDGDGIASVARVDTTPTGDVENQLVIVDTDEAEDFEQKTFLSTQTEINKF